jgi:cytochrome c oxidase subunit III
MNKYQPIPDSTLLREKINRNMLYIGIFTVVMLFAALTSAVILRSADSGWSAVAIPRMFWISTGVILFSSLTLNMAFNAARKNAFNQVRLFLGITLLLGIAFGICQLYGWKEMLAQNIYMTGSTASPAGSYVYFISFLHLVHILAGLIYLLVIWIKSFRNRYNSGNLMGIRHASIFWHFLDGLWIYLFVFLVLFM